MEKIHWRELVFCCTFERTKTSIILFSIDMHQTMVYDIHYKE